MLPPFRLERGLRLYTRCMGRRALFVVPRFSTHGERRQWQDLEEIFNPCGVFERVVILSPGDPEGERELGSLFLVGYRQKSGLPWLISADESLYGRFGPLARAACDLAENHTVDFLAQRFGGPLFHGVPVVWAARRLGLPALITVQNDYTSMLRYKGPVSRRLRGSIEPPAWQYLFHHAHAIWCVSRFVHDWARKKGAPDEKLVTIPNKIDYGLFQSPPEEETRERIRQEVLPDSWRSSSPRFLSVGRLIEQKNYLHMLEAFARFSRSYVSARWLVVGEGPLESKLKRRIRTLGLSGAVTLCSRPLSTPELAVLYREADALLFVSRFEGQGRVALEALACGVPVIGPNQEPVSEMVLDGETGALADPGSVEEIRLAMVRVESGEISSQSLGDRCRDLARQYDYHRVNRMEADLYRRLCQ